MGGRPPSVRRTGLRTARLGTGAGWPFGLTTCFPSTGTLSRYVSSGRMATPPTTGADTACNPWPSRAGASSPTPFSQPSDAFWRSYRDELRRAPNVVTYLGANAVDLETPAPPQQVSAVQVACLAGTTLSSCRARFVLAMGGIENARLLLLANRVQPAGLGTATIWSGATSWSTCTWTRLPPSSPQRSHQRLLYVRPLGSGRRLRGILGLTPELRRRER